LEPVGIEIKCFLDRSKGPSPLGPDAISKATTKIRPQTFTTTTQNAKRHSSGFPKAHLTHVPIIQEVDFMKLQ